MGYHADNAVDYFFFRNQYDVTYKPKRKKEKLMATNNYSFTGKVKYAKVWPGQVDRKFATDSKGGNWSVILTLADEDVKRWNALVTKPKAVTETDIAIFKLKFPDKQPPELNDVTLRRNERHPKLGELGSPAVVGVQDGTAIGNGSVCTTSVDVYDYVFEGQAGTAARLVSLKVETLVPYVKTTPAVNPDEPPVF